MMARKMRSNMEGEKRKWTMSLLAHVTFPNVDSPLVVLKSQAGLVAEDVAGTAIVAFE